MTPTEAKKRSDDIEKALRQERREKQRKAQNQISIAILGKLSFAQIMVLTDSSGVAEAGKSTITKQMKLLWVRSV
jgi:hypothetical protein